MSVREIFVAKAGIVHVHIVRDYNNNRTVEDLFDVQEVENIGSNFCDKRFGKTVRYPNKLYFGNLN